MPAPMGEQLHSGLCPHSTARPTANSLTMLYVVLEASDYSVCSSMLMREETDHLMETNNHHLLNFRSMIHANAQGESLCPTLSLRSGFRFEFLLTDFVVDFSCSRLCFDNYIKNYILLYNFAFIYLFVCFLAHLVICTGRRGRRALNW